MSEAKNLVHRWIAIFNERDFDACRAIGAAAYVEHAVAPFGRVAPGEVDGPTHLRQTAEWLLAQFPDLRMTVVALAADRETVAVRVLAEGTNLGPLNGMIAPTGRRFSAEQSHWFRIRDGRLAEHWATRDDLAAMLQLGVLERPGPPDAPLGNPSRPESSGAVDR
jgi:predicted ester cyclase